MSTADHAQLCVPPHAIAHRNLYLLARSVVIVHLEQNLKIKHPEIALHTFRSFEESEFEEYLETSGIYFVMCHDGAFSNLGPEAIKHATDVDVDEQLKVSLRTTIWQFITSGFNVALINGLETRDTKVMARIVEGGYNDKMHASTLKRTSTNHNSNWMAPASILKALSLDGQSGPVAAFLKSWPSHFSERLALVTYTLSRMVQVDQRPEYSPLASAFLVHALLLKDLPLTSRRLKEIMFDRREDTEIYRSFLDDFSQLAREAIEDSQWRRYFIDVQTSCDVADLVDARLFKTVLLEIQGQPNAASLLSHGLTNEYNSLAGFLETQSGAKLQLSEAHDLSGRVLSPPLEKTKVSYLLPFSNKVFDEHLSSIRIDIDIRDSLDNNGKSARIFREITHWHNKRALDPVKAVKIRNDKAGQRFLKSNQRYMDEMMKYAASLTNAAGKMLEPQTITVTKGAKTPAPAPSTGNKKQSVGFGTKKGDPKGKSAPSKTKELAQASIEQKKNALIEKSFASWIVVKNTFDNIIDPEARYQRVEKYLNDLPTDKMSVVGPEIILYSLQPLLWIWSGLCQAKRREEGYRVVALLWSQINRLWKMEEVVTEAILSHISEICRLLNLPSKPEVKANSHSRKLSFRLTIPNVSSSSLALDLPPHEFQLVHCGPYMDRNMDSRPDSRVPFHPDGWQRTVLDELDADHSVFVVAPTSAGKTFISFYAMEKVLRGDDNGVLVYVAPTKALVNQIAAEVQARFSKRYEYGGKSVWAIHTREYRVNVPTGCQILVTVPHILQIMLLSPSNAKSWAPRVKRIIFDEIHSIGNAEDGVVWEQLLLLAPCPIIALSATVGNPGQFHDWLASTQKSSGFETTIVTHKHRYSDLRKFIYIPPKKFVFEGLARRLTLGTVGLDNVKSFHFFHPISSLVNRSRGIPADLALEARDCLSLYKAMKKYQTPDYPVSEELNPQLCYPSIIQKIHVTNWEKKLMDTLACWMTDSKSPFDQVLQELSQPLESMQAEDLQVSAAKSINKVELDIDSESLFQTALPLITSLNEQNALPAIFFSFDRNVCEKMALEVFSRLEESEKTWKAESPKWKTVLAGYEKWQKANSGKAAKVAKPKKATDKDEERTSKAEGERESAQREWSIYESFDPKAPCEEFSFADLTKVLDSEMNEYVRQLEWKGVTGWLVSALKRGIGIHHAGMNRKYRQIVEILFRKGFLRVVIATGTLALGINMPCKTVVFSGDSVFLTALNFRQCAGRAGRRGFDLLGNVVFHCVPLDKVCRLVSSRLPDLNGHFPTTTTLVLRLFSLLYESKNSTFAQKAINSLLSQPRLYLGGESFRDQVLHHVRFSIEYLRRQQLLGVNGEPINFTSCVSHLYFTENSAFAFHALLKAGYFHELCASILHKPQSTLRQLMLVMAHLFGRLPCRLSDVESMEKFVKKYSSVVFLPELPKLAQAILLRHNGETLQIFTNYVTTFAKQHTKGNDRTLPLTGLQLGGFNDDSTPWLTSLPPTIARSHFVALSGHSDIFSSVSDLCSSTRSGIFLEKAVIPQLDIPSAVPLNAYLYDFFLHGDVKTLERANRIKNGQVWELLNNFSLVLATIVTSLENFLKIVPIDETEMANLSGQGDVLAEYEREDTESFAASEASNKAPAAKMAQPVTKSKKKEAVPDSWEGLDSDDETIVTAGDTEDTSTARDAESVLSFDDSGSTGSTSDEGLMNVLVAFRQLKAEFDEKFKAMWA